MNDIVHNLAHARGKISTAMASCGRSSEEVTLFAISKVKSASAIEEAITVGRHAFGENYVQEEVDKIRCLQERGVNNLQRHSIGPLQSNKSRLVAERPDWRHTIDRPRTAARLSEQHPAESPLLNVLIQINISDENSKPGIPLTEPDVLAIGVTALSRIILHGLIAILAPEPDYIRQPEVA